MMEPLGDTLSLLRVGRSDERRLERLDGGVLGVLMVISEKER